jgi:hypothetical protein
MVMVVSFALCARLANAQPAAAPSPPAGSSVPAPDEPSEVRLRAGIGAGRYSEVLSGLKFEADIQPFVLVAGEGAFRSGRATIVVQASAGVGTQVDMRATQNGNIVQQNHFHQEVFEGSPRVRWPINPTIYVEGGYRLTVQRLHFTEIPTLGDALETVTVHALEIGFGWHRMEPDTALTAFDVIVGMNHGSAENDRIEGENFTAGGFCLISRLRKRWASRFGLEGVYSMRQENGSSAQQVTLNGMAVSAIWPSNTTWTLLALAGYSF